VTEVTQGRSRVATWLFGNTLGTLSDQRLEIMRERGDEFRVAGINVQKGRLAVRHMHCLLADLAVSELPQPCRFRRFIPTGIYSCPSHNGTSDDSTRQYSDEKHELTPAALFWDQCDNALRIGRVPQIREKDTDP
jgi:hypothetical protein